MVKIIPSTNNNALKKLNERLRNKLSTIGTALAPTQIPSSQFAKLALSDLEWAEPSLIKLRLKNKINPIRKVLNDYFSLRHPTKASLEASRQAFSSIESKLDTLPRFEHSEIYPPKRKI